MFFVSLKKVLAQYRKKRQPYTSIEVKDISEAAGLLTAMSIPASPHIPQTKTQKVYEKAARTMKRCAVLVETIEQHEKI